VLAERYEKVCGTKKCKEFMEELQKMSVMNPDEAGGHDTNQQAKSSEIIGQEYGMTGRNIARYMRVDKLIMAEQIHSGSQSGILSNDM